MSRIEAIRRYWNSHPLGTQFVLDSSIPMASREFFDHIRPHMNPYRFPWVMAEIEKEAQGLQGKSLLEIGCGMGFDSLEFLRRGVRVTAIDLTPAAVDLARRHFQLERFEAETLEGNALQLDFPDESFDAVYSNGVIHATGDTQRAIDEIWRVLKPGGRALIWHFYRRYSWMWFLSVLGRENIEFETEDPPVNEFYSRSQILEMFHQFQVLECRYEHYRAIPTLRKSFKAQLFNRVFVPIYNALPETIAKPLAYKISVTAIKRFTVSR